MVCFLLVASLLSDNRYICVPPWALASSSKMTTSLTDSTSLGLNVIMHLKHLVGYSENINHPFVVINIIILLSSYFLKGETKCYHKGTVNWCRPDLLVMLLG